jgi:hypothetical protein
MSASGEVKDYLRWRFACRAGDLLICDPWLLGDDTEAVVTFLRAMARPVRALAGGIPNGIDATLTTACAEGIDIRQLPGGRHVLHDRVWLVGETGLLVGTSLNALVVGAARGRPRATTTTELPHADALAWRQQFEAWWAGTNRSVAHHGASQSPGR